MSISSTSIINPDNAAAVIAADARAGFRACQACSAFSLPGEISGGRINGGASPPSCV
ncbi:hypothetical protein [Klebsiella pneumoniae]|uniref:hypothetical protein n=1 Tax=Klebsiella pneumoniae TaxID=573 RepID=UPI0023B313C5|nr:hypothetical protein [Klebsiella pneumoniae]